MIGSICAKCLRDCDGCGAWDEPPAPRLEDREVCEHLAEIGDRLLWMDTESTHRVEDAVSRAVLRAIAAGAVDPVKAATDLLVILDFNRTRWFA